MCLAHLVQAKSACASESTHSESCDIGEIRQRGSPMGGDDTTCEVPTLIAMCQTHLLWKRWPQQSCLKQHFKLSQSVSQLVIQAVSQPRIQNQQTWHDDETAMSFHELSMSAIASPSSCMLLHTPWCVIHEFPLCKQGTTICTSETSKIKKLSPAFGSSMADVTLWKSNSCLLFQMSH